MLPKQEVELDALFLHRVAAGDHYALGELYDRYSRLLFGLVVRVLNDRAEAEEVLQDVFVQAWTHAHTYDRALGTPGGWLIAIARNRAIDRLRAKARQLRTPEAAAAPAPVDTPERLACLTEQRERVHRALSALPPEQRDLIERAYFLGSTQSEMAAQLGLPLGTVKTRIRTGLQALRCVLTRTSTEA